MTDKEKVITDLREALDSIDITSDLRLVLIHAIEYLQKEPVSEDLEEEISNYIKDNFFGSKSMGFLSNRTKGELDSVDVANIARHFAEWQKQKDMQDFMEKAEKFFNSELYVSISNQICSVDEFSTMKNFVKQFKNYMQDESEN